MNDRGLPAVSDVLMSHRELLSGIDPESIPSSRTAISAERTVELLEAMIESSKKESVAQHNRFVAETIIGLAAVLASSAAAFASLYALYLALSSV